MTPGDLMELHERALFVHDEADHLVRVNERNGRPAPLVYLGRHAGGTMVRLRGDAPQGLAEAIAACVARLYPFDPQAAGMDTADVLAETAGRFAPITERREGPAFRFPSPLFSAGAIPLYPNNAGLLHPALATWGPDLPHYRPAFAVVLDGRAIAICASSRSTPEAADAGLETAPDYRGRGAAGLATVAWAAAIRQSGRIPFYSTTWTNEASRAVARKLELVLIGEDVQVG